MLNKIMLVGRLTKDPERRGNNPEMPIAYLRLAVDRNYKRKGEQETDYFDVSAFGKQAETILNNLKKGRLIDLVGEMHFREWTDSQTGEKKYGSEVHLTEFHFLEKKENTEAPVLPAAQAAPAPMQMQQNQMPAQMQQMAAPAYAQPPVSPAYAPAYAQTAPVMAPQPAAPAGTPVAYGPGGQLTDDVPF